MSPVLILISVVSKEKFIRIYLELGVFGCCVRFVCYYVSVSLINMLLCSYV
jgi:hypothetical protein